MSAVGRCCCESRLSADGAAQRRRDASNALPLPLEADNEGEGIGPPPANCTSDNHGCGVRCGDSGRSTDLDASVLIPPRRALFIGH